MTLFANRPILLSVLLLAPAALVYLCTPGQDRGSVIGASGGPGKAGSIAPLPALTTYRAHMMLMTVLGILAVDFPVFPRALAKCESYGVSVMDLGVGSFVFSNGIMAAIPLVKNPAHLKAPLLPKVASVLRKTLPIIALGIVRVLLVKGTDYPEHETEYGTHWNFFVTLALLPVMQVFLHPLIKMVPISVLAFGVGLLHQVSLSLLGVKQWVKFAPRVDLITANKEGLVSLLGYLSIYLFGTSLGTIILPPTPKFFPRLIQNRTTPAELAFARQNDKTAVELASYAIIWWALLGLFSLLRVDEGVSRQLANLPYVLWIVAFNTSFILGYLLLDMAFYPAPKVLKKRPTDAPAPASSYFAAEPGTRVVATDRAPPLLEALNKNGLPVFLLANVGTGIVNLSMQTIMRGSMGTT
uniref:GPI-anchored wall transfer protein n=1 Tax=Mycena chlorophos TaxID=658473 RepID=A0ABQ0KVA8_MYCCL|nr:predicted protein [Mycena chlorophos]